MKAEMFLAPRFSFFVKPTGCALRVGQCKMQDANCKFESSDFRLPSNLRVSASGREVSPSLCHLVTLSPCHLVTSPRGISLLEVLIAVFVLSVGLMSVAALVPVGRWNINQTGKADRSSACGRAAQRHVKVSGMLDPVMWMQWNTQISTPAWTRVGVASNGALTLTNLVPPNLPPQTAPVPFVIDPYFIAYNVNNGASAANLTFFPYANTTTNTSTSPNTPAAMPRITLAAIPLPWSTTPSSTPPLTPMGLLQAQRDFVWRDDLLLQINNDGHRARPIVRYDSSAGPTAPFPYYASELTGAHTPLAWVNAGDYSWLVTLSPVADESGQVDATSQQYTLSIVVFYQRPGFIPTTPAKIFGGYDATVNPKPSERAISVMTYTNPSNRQTTTTSYPNTDGTGATSTTGSTLSFPDSGWGGGSVIATVPAVVPADYLDVHANDWVLLMYTPNGAAPSICQWYQVLSATVLDPNTLSSSWQPGFGLGLTLTGPDWKDPGITNASSTPPYAAQNTTLVLVSGVVGVYSTTVQLDRGALYNRGPWKVQ